MKVLLDPQIFLTQKFGGISRLFVEVWKNSVDNKEINFECPLVYSENYHLNESGLEPKNIFNVFHKLNFKGTGRIKDMLKASSISKTEKKLKAQQFDVFLSTYYETYFLDHLNGKPFILTVYDMIHEIFPEYFTWDIKTIPQKKLLIQKADKIIAISNQTKKDILKFYPDVSPEKIDVVYLSQTIIDKGATVKGLPSNFMLFVGNRGGYKNRGAYKNFKLLAETAVPFLKDDPSLHIVCAGGGKLSGTEIEMLEQLNIDKQIIQRDYRDSELASFYKAAKMFVFPSAYEGFGIPTLEAMKCGCPVILADSSCLPEVGGDAVKYFQSGNRSSLANAIDEVLKDRSLREELIKKGFKQVEEFSWKKTAEGYFNVIKKFA
jgi:glycosyltransferase involved in cell wall biosynthesis